MSWLIVLILVITIETVWRMYMLWQMIQRLCLRLPIFWRHFLLSWNEMTILREVIIYLSVPMSTSSSSSSSYPIFVHDTFSRSRVVLYDLVVSLTHNPLPGGPGGPSEDCAALPVCQEQCSLGLSSPRHRYTQASLPRQGGRTEESKEMLFIRFRWKQNDIFEFNDLLTGQIFFWSKLHY